MRGLRGNSKSRLKCLIWDPAKLVKSGANQKGEHSERSWNTACASEAYRNASSKQCVVRSILSKPSACVTYPSCASHAPQARGFIHSESQSWPQEAHRRQPIVGIQRIASTRWHPAVARSCSASQRNHRATRLSQPHFAALHASAHRSAASDGVMARRALRHLDDQARCALSLASPFFPSAYTALQTMKLLCTVLSAISASMPITSCLAGAGRSAASEGVLLAVVSAILSVTAHTTESSDSFA